MTRDHRRRSSRIDWQHQFKMGPSAIGCFLFLFSMLDTCVGVKFLLTVPKEVFYDSNIVVSVSASGVLPRYSETVTLEYRGKNDQSRVLNVTTLRFTSDGLQTWNVMFSWERIHSIEETGLQLTMSSGKYEVKKELTFSQNFGYIFIQTDKPVYTPLQSVKFRVIAVDEFQKLAKYFIQIEIKNAKQIVIDRQMYTAEEAFKAKEFELPKDTPSGEWSITASFEGKGNTNGASHTAKFEVKEYVLPRFSSQIQVDPDVITKDTFWITVVVKSSYVYGRPLAGTVYLKLGTWDSGMTEMLPVNFTGPLTNGEFTKDIRVEGLLSNLPFTRNNRLYVKATVTESASLETHVIEDTSTFISHPYYLAQVLSQSGKPASWVTLYVLSMFRDKQDRYIGGNGTYFMLNSQGEITQDFDIPLEAHNISFTAIAADPKAAQFERFSHVAEKYNSTNNEFIHISIVTPVKKTQAGVVLLRYTKPVTRTSYRPETITVLVLARGHVIFTTTSVRNLNGRSNVQLPARLFPEISPSMRIVAFYNVQSEYIIDSLFVDTPEVCLEELSLMPPEGTGADGTMVKPKENYLLKVVGGPNMNVGFVAVDDAVFLINNNPTLTRHIMFSKFESHDKGVGSGDGGNLERILGNSGLLHLIIDTDSIKVQEYWPSVGHVAWIGGKSGIAPVTTIPKIEAPPPQSTRHYFPESWFFEERTLPKDGRLSVNLTLPDTITTWSFLAVGMSATRGICVSAPLKQPVQKLFFADVSLPYKATRLEEVKVKITVYNYQLFPVNLTVVVTGSKELCFSANTVRGNSKNSTSFTMRLGAGQSKSEAVTAEGQRVRKSITFVLDPEGKHATFSPSKKNRTILCDSATVSNVIDVERKTQTTSIDLSLPSNVIKGTESCKISAFGDLMGDIITHAVVESRKLIDTPLTYVEEILGDLAPTVHALISATNFDLLDDNVKAKGQKFVLREIIRLQKYRHDNNGYVLIANSKPSTWLTAFVLKTLCHAQSLVFVDKEQLINDGFHWLIQQINMDGTIKEQVPRETKNMVESGVMLGAEVLISIMECKKTDLDQQQLVLQGKLVTYLMTNFRHIKDPMVLAKVTYAFMLYDKVPQQFEEAVKRLLTMKRTTKQGHSYWSKLENAEESKRTPYWYHKAPHASAIEATAYVLLVFVRHRRINIDAIADWLVGQRNYNGAFISATDSTVAIQALAEYSYQRHGQQVLLQCNVSADRMKEYFHSFTFTEANAISKESVHDVPVGQVLDVLTLGQGLGQMQVNVEYNIPIDKNQNCPFQIHINISKTMVKWSGDMLSNPLCTYCDIGCPKPANAPIVTIRPANQTAKPVAAQMVIKVKKPGRKRNGKTGNGRKNTTTRNPRNQNPRPGGRRTRRPGQAPRTTRRLADVNNSRRPRAVSDNPSASRKSICVHVCLQHTLQGASESVEVRVEMLTGYQPVMTDIEKIRDLPYVRHVDYESSRDVLLVQFTQISCTERTCFAFRAVDVGEAERLTPANVEVIQFGTAAPQCVLQYHALADEESLQVYCADFSNTNRGECRCYSGLCGLCKPAMKNELTLNSVVQMVCDAPIAYQLQINNVTNTGNWVEINSKVISINKTGSDNITTGSVIKLTTPSSCMCPLYQYRNSLEKFYLLSTDVERLVDINGNYVHKYLLDEQSVILRVADRGATTMPDLSVPHYYLHEALRLINRCY